MYARVNIIFAQSDKIDASIADIERSARAKVETTRGNRGLTTLVDRRAGVIVAMSYWDEPSHSSEAPLTQARENAVAAAGGDLVVENYEVALAERLSAPAPGAVVQMTPVQLEPPRVADGLALLHREVLPQLRMGPGFCSADVLIDRHSGNGIFVTAWEHGDDAARAGTILDQLREEVAEQVGAKFFRAETYVIVGASAPLN